MATQDTGARPTHPWPFISRDHRIINGIACRVLLAPTADRPGLAVPIRTPGKSRAPALKQTD